MDHARHIVVTLLLGQKKLPTSAVKKTAFDSLKALWTFPLQVMAVIFDNRGVYQLAEASCILAVST